jgi:hypothetical protein
MFRPFCTPSYQLHKPSGQAVVTLNGVDHYLGNYDTPESRAAYDRLIAEWLANGRRFPPKPGAYCGDLTVAELIASHRLGGRLLRQGRRSGSRAGQHLRPAAEV